MFTQMKKRTYRQTRRAQQQEETRLRITEAAMALHEEIGPRDTTIAAIAARAGVERLTVYRHFSDTAAIFHACTSHWLALHPPPEAAAWRELRRPKARARRALRALYAYYRDTSTMWSRAYRDVEDVAALQAPMAAFEAYLARMRTDLAGAWRRSGRPGAKLAAALALATHFRTWETLHGQGMDDDAMAGMMADCCATLARAEAPARASTVRSRGKKRS
jgi:AcrR family transcriptional regulator